MRISPSDRRDRTVVTCYAPAKGVSFTLTVYGRPASEVASQIQRHVAGLGWRHTSLSDGRHKRRFSAEAR